MLNQLAAADAEQVVKFAQFACADEPDLLAKVKAEIGRLSHRYRAEKGF